MKIGLGSVQFGVDYGVSNQNGKTKLEDVKEILLYAASQGISVIDTASMYGDCETVLGQAMQSSHAFSVVTKTPHFDDEVIKPNHGDYLRHSFQKSLDSLKQQSVYALLIHNANDLLKPDASYLYESMHDLKLQGLVKKIGVSVYDGEQIDDVLNHFNIDIIQLPLNVFDQRLIKSGHLQLLKNKGIEIHARSIFLQGLLLMSPDELPEYFLPIREHIRKFQHKAKEQNTTSLGLALQFVLMQDEIDVALCGVNTVEHLRQIVEAASTLKNQIDFSNFSLSDAQFISPPSWKID